MKSLLYQTNTGLDVPDSCQIGTRVEVPVNIRWQGRTYRFVAREQLVPEDPYLVMVKAAAHAVITGEQYNGTPPGRDVKDFLVQNTLRPRS